MKRSIALLLALVSLISLFALTACESNAEEQDTEQGTAQNTESDGLDENEGESDVLYIRGTCTERTVLEYRAIYEETGRKPIDFNKLPEKVDDAYPDVEINVYYAVGFDKYRIVSEEEYAAIQQYQNETGKQIIYPTVSYSDRKYLYTKNRYDANIYYLLESSMGVVVRPKLDKDGKFNPNYWTYEAGNPPTMAVEYNSLRIEGAEGFVGEDGKTHYYVYGRRVDGGVEVRMFMYEYYLYVKETQPENLSSIENIFKMYSREFN